MYTPLSVDYSPVDLEMEQEAPEVTAAAVCPAEFKDDKKREELAKWLANVLNAAEAQQRDRYARWDRVKRLYDNDPPSRSYQPYKGHANEHYGIVQPKLDALAGMVVGTVTSKEPYCRAIPLTEDLKTGSTEKELEDDVHKAIVKSKGKFHLKKAAVTSGWSNAGHIVAERDEDKVRICHKAPQDTLVYPMKSEDLKCAKLYAYREWIDQETIDDQKKEKFYFDVEVSTKEPTATAKEALPGQQTPSETSPDANLDPIPVWKCVFKKNGKTYGATFNKESVGLLRVWEYEYETPCMFKCAYKVCSEDSYYTAGSVGNDLQNPQLTINELCNMLVDGLRKSVFPTLAVPGTLANDSMDQRLSEGDIVPVPGLDRGVPFLAQVNVQPLMIAISDLKNHADTVARVSQAASAGQFRKGATATEVGSVMQGQAEARDDYIETFSMGVEAMYAHVHEILTKINPGKYPEVSDVKWSPTSTSPAATPETVVAILKELYAFAQDPRSGLSVRNLITEVLENVERLGVVNALNLQDAQPQQPALPGPMDGMGEPPSDPVLAQLMGGQAEGDPTGQPLF